MLYNNGQNLTVQYSGPGAGELHMGDAKFELHPQQHALQDELLPDQDPPDAEQHALDAASLQQQLQQPADHFDQPPPEEQPPPQEQQQQQ